MCIIGKPEYLWNKKRYHKKQNVILLYFELAYVWVMCTLRLSKTGFLNLKESEYRLCFSLWNSPRSSGSWCVKGSQFFGFFDAPWSVRSWIDPSSKETKNPISDSFGFKDSILDHSLINATLQLGYIYPTIMVGFGYRWHPDITNWKTALSVQTWWLSGPLYL